MDFKDWVELTNIDENTHFSEWENKVLSETTSTRYSIEVNFRSTPEEVMEVFAKICLGYVGAALKQNGYHTKHVYDIKPLRIMVSSRNWDDGEWVGMASFSPEHKCFLISKGFFNKDRKTVSIQSSKKCGDSAAEITKELRNLMHGLKKEPDRHRPKMKGIPLKRGPKK